MAKSRFDRGFQWWIKFRHRWEARGRVRIDCYWVESLQCLSREQGSRPKPLWQRHRINSPATHLHPSTETIEKKNTQSRSDPGLEPKIAKEFTSVELEPAENARSKSKFWFEDRVVAQEIGLVIIHAPNLEEFERMGNGQRRAKAVLEAVFEEINAQNQSPQRIASRRNKNP